VDHRVDAAGSGDAGRRRREEIGIEDGVFRDELVAEDRQL